MKLGFTGTRKGMTAEQIEVVAHHFDDMTIGQVHHGDCVGSDEEAHDIALASGVKWIEIHPPSLYTHRAFCHHDQSEDLIVVVHRPYDYLKRNWNIVDATDGLVATPSGPEQDRSGTWATIRYARRKHKPVLIIYPDGTQVTEVNQEEAT